MTIRQRLEKLGGFVEKVGKSRGRKAMLVALSVLLSLNILLAAIPGSAFAAADTVGSMMELVSAIENAYIGSETTIKLSGDFEIAEPIRIPSNKNIHLTSAYGDCTITRAGTLEDSMFLVDGFSTALTVGDGVCLDGGSYEASAPLVQVGGAACFVLDGGKLINGNNVYGAVDGGAVAASGGATVTLLDGEISGNYCYGNGGAVCLTDGSVFIMRGGEISGNDAYIGGGIYAENSDAYIYRGDIDNNTADYKGGGAYFSGCQNVLLAADTGSSVKVSANKAPIGSGIYLRGKPVGGETAPNYTISGNVVIDDNPIATGYYYSLPTSTTDTECNLLMETSNDAPSISGMVGGSRIGLYALQHNTVIPVSMDYYPSVLSLDHNKTFFEGDAANSKPSYMTHTDSALTIGLQNGMPTVTVAQEDYANGEIVADLGDTFVDESGALWTYCGFPALLRAEPASGYVLGEDDGNDEFTVVKNGSEIDAYGSAEHGLWYTFTDASAKAVAVFEAADTVASFNGANYTSVEAAVADAAAWGPEAEVTLLKSATIRPTSIPAGSDITIKGASSGLTLTRIQSDTSSSFTVGKGASLTLDGVALSGNFNLKDASSVVKVNGGRLALVNNARITNGHAAEKGGAVYLNGGVLDIGMGCTLDNNSAPMGGAVYMTGDSVIMGDPADNNSQITTNKFTTAGGGVYMDGGVITDCDISNNTYAPESTGTKGGGVYIVGGRLENVTVGGVNGTSGFSNSAHTGAGVYVEKGAFEDVTVKNNSAVTEAGGVYSEGSLSLAGNVVVSGNKCASGAKDMISKAPLSVSGTLDSGSSVNVWLDTASQTSGTVIAKCDTEREANLNRNYISIENSTTLKLVPSGKDIVVAPASECISFALVKAADSDAFDSDPVVGKEIFCSAENPSFCFEVSASESLGVHYRVLDASGSEVSEDDVWVYETGYGYDNGVVTHVAEIRTGEGFNPAAGSKYTVEISAGHDYSPSTITGYAPLTDWTCYSTDNSSIWISEDGIEYYASEMFNGVHALDATYYDWNTADSDDDVEAKLSAAKNKEYSLSSFDGYVKLVPRVGDGNTDIPALGDDVSSVTITVHMGNYANDGDTVDFVSYSGGSNKDAALHKDLMVRNGKVSFDVPRGSGTDADSVYIAMVIHNDPVASIGSTKYPSLAEAFEEAEPGDEIKLLKDTDVHTALLVRDEANIKLTADSPMRITRGDAYDGAMIFIEGGSSFTMNNIIVDGAGDLESADGAESDAPMVVNYGTLSVSADSEFVNGVFNDYNYYTKFSGGALCNLGKAEIKDAVFDSCSASRGGAIYNDGELKLEDCVVRGSRALEAGGIYNDDDGLLTLTDTAVTGNSSDSSDGSVGGVYNSGTLNVAGNVSVSGNTDRAGKPSNTVNKSATPITIVAALDSSARIGFSQPSKPGDIVAAGDGQKVTDATGYVENFFPDTVNRTVTSDAKKVVIGTALGKYHIVSLAAGANGAITPEGDVRVNEGDDLALTVTPDAGYTVSDLLVDGASVFDKATVNATTGIAKYKLTDVKKDAKVEAVFKLTPGSIIEVKDSTGGKISPSGAIRVNSEESVDFTITPNSGDASNLLDDYYLDTVKVDGKDVIDDVVKNADGTYTYTMSGVTADKSTLTASFKPVYESKKLSDEASGIDVSGLIHHKAKLVVENLYQEKYMSLYNGFVSKLSETNTYKQYIAQAYEIRLEFDDPNMTDVPAYIRTQGVNVTFNLGSSYAGKVVRVFHGSGSSIETDKYIFSPVAESGVINVAPDSLSPFAVVVQEPKSTGSGTGNGTGTGTGNGTGNGTGSGSATDDKGKGPVSGDYSEPRTVPPVVVVLLVLSAATVFIIVGSVYMPRLTEMFRRKYGSRFSR